MIRLSLRVRRADAEIVLAELLELAGDGVEEVEVDAGSIEYAVYGAPGELPSLPDLRAAVGGALVEVKSSEIPDDWAERWKQFHRPVLIEREPARPAAGGTPSATPAAERPPAALYVRAPWQPPSPRTDAVEIVIDPGQAFGTGAHHTTRLCLRLLLDAAAEGPSGQTLDLGTGSGVLAIAAAKLGLGDGPVHGFDNEPESVQAALANARANGVAISARRLDLRRETLPPMAGALVTANLLRPLLLELAQRIDEPPERMILSGLLAQEADEVAGAFAERLGMRERRRLHGGEWAAVLLCSPAG